MEKYTFITRPDNISRDIEKQIDEELSRTEGFERDDEHPHTVIVIGGDGTFIYAVHQFIDQLDHIQFHGLHTGTLGFYTDFRDCEIEEFLEVYKSGDYNVRTYPLLKASDSNGNEVYAINEIRIENAARTQMINVYLDGEYFETFRGSGMSVCTQLGSTAYNRSVGGAVIQEGLNLIELAEISGIHHSKFRSLDAPFVLKADTVIELRSSSYTGALLGYDADVYSLDSAKNITIKVCESCSVHVIRGKKVSYFDRLKSLF